MRAIRSVHHMSHCDFIRLQLRAPSPGGEETKDGSSLALGGLLRHLLDNIATPSKHVCMLDPFDCLRPHVLDRCARKTMPVSVHLFNTRTRTLHLAAGSQVPAQTAAHDVAAVGGLNILGTSSKLTENAYVASARVATSSDLGSDVVVFAFIPSAMGLPTIYTGAGIEHFLQQLHDSGVTHVMFAQSAWNDWTKDMHCLWVSHIMTDDGDELFYPEHNPSFNHKGLELMESLGGRKNPKIVGAFAENMFGLPVPAPIARTYSMSIIPEVATARILAVTCSGDVKTARIDASGRAQITYDMHDNNPFQGELSLVTIGGDVRIDGQLTIFEETTTTLLPEKLVRFPINDFADIIAIGSGGDVPTLPDAKRRPQTNFLDQLTAFYTHPWVQRARTALVVWGQYGRWSTGPGSSESAFQDLFRQIQAYLRSMVEYPDPTLCAHSLAMREKSTPIPGAYGC